MAIRENATSGAVGFQSWEAPARPFGLPAEHPDIAALTATFAHDDGIKVLHETIQYPSERAEREREWLDLLAQSDVPTTLIWGLLDPHLGTSRHRLAAPGGYPGLEPLLDAQARCEPLPAVEPSRPRSGGVPSRSGSRSGSYSWSHWFRLRRARTCPLVSPPTARGIRSSDEQPVTMSHRCGSRRR
jgi:hypothetical protein